MIHRNAPGVVAAVVFVLLAGCYRTEIDETKQRLATLENKMRYLEDSFRIGKSEHYVATANLDIYAEAKESPSALIAVAHAGAYLRRSTGLEIKSGLVPVEFPCNGEFYCGYARAEGVRREMLDAGTFSRLGAVNPIEVIWQKAVLQKMREQSIQRLGVAITNRAKLPVRDVDDIFDGVYSRFTNTGLVLKRVVLDDENAQPTLWKMADIEAVLHVIIDDQRLRIRLMKFDGTVLHVGYVVHRPADAR